MSNNTHLYDFHSDRFRNEEIRPLRASTPIRKEAQLKFELIDCSDEMLHPLPGTEMGCADSTQTNMERAKVTQVTICREPELFRCDSYNSETEYSSETESTLQPSTFDDSGGTLVGIFDKDSEDETPPVTPIPDSEDDSISIASVSVSYERQLFREMCSLIASLLCFRTSRWILAHLVSTETLAWDRRYR